MRRGDWDPVDNAVEPLRQQAQALARCCSRLNMRTDLTRGSRQVTRESAVCSITFRTRHAPAGGVQHTRSGSASAPGAAATLRNVELSARH
jgi:hypothetical protein